MKMNVKLSAAQELPRVNFPKGLKLFQNRKEKVVVIIGATGTGKTKLAIDIATRLPPAEIVNSDKIQVYKGLDITTNKVTQEECAGIPHHLLGTVHDPDVNFTAADFCRHAVSAVDSIVERNGLPIIAGGSNSYIDALVNHHAEFRLHYECCILWVDVSLPVLHSSLHARADRMIHAGQVDEVRRIFHPHADYTRGIRRAIGVPEFHRFLEAEASGASPITLKNLLEAAIAAIKSNNCSLANRQVHKIRRLHGLWKRSMHRLDATHALLADASEDAWHDHVLAKSLVILREFLFQDARVPAGILSPNGVIAAAVHAPLPPVALAATRFR